VNYALLLLCFAIPQTLCYKISTNENRMASANKVLEVMFAYGFIEVRIDEEMQRAA